MVKEDAFCHNLGRNAKAYVTTGPKATPTRGCGISA